MVLATFFLFHFRLQFMQGFVKVRNLVASFDFQEEEGLSRPTVPPSWFAPGPRNEDFRTITNNDTFDKQATLYSLMR